jgi:hypothetical protein
MPVTLKRTLESMIANGKSATSILRQMIYGLFEFEDLLKSNQAVLNRDFPIIDAIKGKSF